MGLRGLSGAVNWSAYGMRPFRTYQCPPSASRSRIARCSVVSRGSDARSTGGRRAKVKNTASSSPSPGSPAKVQRRWNSAMLEVSGNTAVSCGIQQPAVTVEGVDLELGEVLGEEAPSRRERCVDLGRRQRARPRDVGREHPRVRRRSTGVQRVALQVELQATQPVEGSRPGDAQPVVGVQTERAVREPVHEHLLAEVGEGPPGVIVTDAAGRVVRPDLVDGHDQGEQLEHPGPVRGVGSLVPPGPGHRAVPRISDHTDRRDQPLRHRLDRGDLGRTLEHRGRRRESVGAIVTAESEQGQPLRQIVGRQPLAYVEHAATLGHDLRGAACDGQRPYWVG